MKVLAFLTVLLALVNYGRAQITASMGDEVFVVEGGAGTVTALVFDVYLSEPVLTTATVTYTVIAGTATSGVDYLVPLNLTVTFLAGSDQESIRIPVVGDALLEDTETLDVVLTSATGVSITFPFASRGYIVNDEGVGATFTSDVSVREAFSFMSFTVTLATQSTVDVSFSYRAFQAVNDTATPGIDYDNIAGSVTIPAGSLSATVTINIIDDTQPETDETFTVEVFRPNKMWFTNITGGATDSLGVRFTILDDDIGIFVSDVSLAEGTGSNTAFVFTVSTSNTLTAGQSAIVDLDIVHITTNAADFSDVSAINSNLTFSSGERSKTVTIFVSGDSTSEATETFELQAQVLASTPEGFIQSGYRSVGTGTIVNDDSNVTLAFTRSVTTSSVAETAGNIVFTVTPSGSNTGGPAGGYSVVVSSVTATNTLDFRTTLPSNDLLAGMYTTTWNAGVTPTAFTFTVTILTDAFLEPDELFTVSVTNLVSTSLTTASSFNYTITDSTVGLFVSNPVSVAEGNSITTPNRLVFPISISKNLSSDLTLTVQYDNTSSSSVATPGVDYTAPSTVTIVAGTTTVSLTVTITGDSIVELDERVSFSLVNIPNTVVVVNNSGSAFILNDDTYIYLEDVSVSEGDVGFSNALMRVFSNQPFPTGATLSYFTPSGTGTATAGTDYSTVQTTVPLPSGAFETFITLIIISDTIAEATETFTVEITSGTGGVGPGVPNFATVTIINDDGPTLSVADTAALEGSGSLVFTLTLDAAAAAGASVGISTGNLVSATPVVDFTVVRNATANFTTGSTNTTFTVTIIDDAVPEMTETLTVLFSNPNFIKVPATLLPTGRIVNDDGIRVGLLSGTTYSLPEGNSGITNFVFFIGPVGTSTGLNSAASVRVETIAGTATANSDYVPISRTVDILTTPVAVTVQVIGDTVPEVTETFTVRFFWPDYVFFNSPATLSLTAQANILGDDFFANISSVQGLEGDLGDLTTKFVFRVTFTGPASEGSTLTYATQDGTALSTATSNDYTAIPSRTVNITTGATDFNITVDVTPDSIPEANETFSVVLTGAYLLNVGSPSAGVGTIINDDFTLTITDQSLYEGDTTQTVTFTYLIDGPAPEGASFKINTQDGTAIAGVNYLPITNQVVNLTTGVTSFNLTLTIIGDTVPGLSTSFTVVFTEVRRLILSSSIARITLVNDDGPVITVAGATALEGNTTASPLVFVITSNAPVATADSGFFVQTRKLTTSVGDFIEISTPTFVNFTAGATQTTVTINTIPDLNIEDTETFELVITNPAYVKFASNVTAAGISAVGTITNDDGLGVTVAALSRVEGTSATAGATTPFVFTITLVGATGGAPAGASLGFEIIPGTATFGSDYTTASGNITFVTGAASASATVLVLADSVDEGQETFFLTLNTPNKVNIIGFTNASATILNDDAVLTVSPASVIEGNNGTTTSLVFNLSLSSPATPAPGTVSFTWTTVGLTATPGVDYITASSTFTFAAGTTSGTISVTVVGDSTPEPDEIVQLNITSVTNCIAPVRLINGTILNDDLQLNLVNDSFYERDTTYGYKFPIFQTVAAPSAAVVTYTVTSFSAVLGRDFILISNQSLTVNTTGTVTYIDFNILGDLVPQGDKFFQVTLTGCTGCVVGGSPSATVLLWEDDYSVAFSTPTYTVTETESAFNLTVSLTTSQPLVTAGPNPEITISTADGSAIAGSDYTARSATYRFASGDSSATFVVQILGDTISEPTETFTVSLSAPTGLKIGNPSTTTVTILDNDARLIRVSHPRVTEGGDAREFQSNLVLKNLTFVISLSGPAVGGSVLEYRTEDGTATAGIDYTTVSGIKNFTAGETSFSVTVPVIADYEQEPTETVFLRIIGFSGSLKTDEFTDGVGTIINDDFKAFGINGIVRGQLRVNNREIA